jgi:hypothetical protein
MSQAAHCRCTPYVAASVARCAVRCVLWQTQKLKATKHEMDELQIAHVALQVRR